VIVEGINFIKKHTKAKGQVKQAGIIELEVPINVSNVMLLCDKCNHPTHIGHQFLEDGRKVRICRSCREVID